MSCNFFPAYDHNFSYAYRTTVFNLHYKKKYILHAVIIPLKNSGKNESARHNQRSKTNNVDNEKADDTHRNTMTDEKHVHSSTAISRDARDVSRSMSYVKR